MPGHDERANSDVFFKLFILVAQTRDALLKARERDYARCGINSDRRAILWLIENNGGRATPVEIARDLFRELNSVSEMLKRMERDGLITRHKGTGRSKTEVRITPKGLDIFNQSYHNETTQKIISALTLEERDLLESLLGKLRSRTLEELGIAEWQIRFPLEAEPAERDAVAVDSALSAGLSAEA
ncbi:MAG TPA: MarR family transcriptional regulator [Chloroflexota bacterium]|nr:MarR family transcriptional regulator [Chloroflexota bacterium]